MCLSVSMLCSVCNGKSSLKLTREISFEYFPSFSLRPTDRPTLSDWESSGVVCIFYNQLPGCFQSVASFPFLVLLSFLFYSICWLWCPNQKRVWCTRKRWCRPSLPRTHTPWIQYFFYVTCFGFFFFLSFFSFLNVCVCLGLMPIKQPTERAQFKAQKALAGIKTKQVGLFQLTGRSSS